MTEPFTPGPSLEPLLASARSEAARLRHEFVGSEHLLLALMRQDQPSLTRLLDELKVDPAAVRAKVETLVPPGAAEPSPEPLALRSGARKTLEQAGAEARRLDLAAPLPEHVFLALLRDRRGVVAQALADTAANLDRARKLLDSRPQAPPGPRAPAPASAPREPRRAREKRPDREPPRPRERSGAEPPAAAPEPEPHPERAQPPRTAILAHRSPILTWRNLLLLAVPVSIALEVMHASPLLIFITACAGVIPLAGYMGDATEHLAERTNPTVGGFLNATFGNAAELIIALVALRAGLVNLVKASITGSILGNLLLILGLSLVAGSRGKQTVRFNRTAAGMSTAMLALALVGLVFPAIFHLLHPDAARRELYLSEGVSVVLGVTYLFSLWFSLRTHQDLFRGEGHRGTGHPWSVLRSVIVLAVATAGVAVESEILVGSVESVTATLHLSEMFLGLVIIPLIGNAAEHATAVLVARKGQMDLALNIALGSSTQVALLVAPILVLAGVLLGQPMDLVFQAFEVASIGMATIVIAIITLDGESHWFEGVQLLAVYALVGVAAFFL